MRLELRLVPTVNKTLEIHSSGDSCRSVGREELDAVAKVPLPEDPSGMIELGRRLYRLLDGPERRLASLAPNSTLDLLFVTEPGQPAAFAHFPWELLHDESGFLIQRGILAVRQISFFPQTHVTPEFPAGQSAIERALHGMLSAKCVTCSELRGRRADYSRRYKPPATLPHALRRPAALKNSAKTVRSYDPFDVFHLTGHGDLYEEARHKRYLAPGQSFPNRRPVLLTEDRRGDCRLADGEMIERAFGDRFPRVVFLSGCPHERTARERSIERIAGACFAYAGSSLQGFSLRTGMESPGARHLSHSGCRSTL